MSVDIEGLLKNISIELVQTAGFAWEAAAPSKVAELAARWAADETPRSGNEAIVFDRVSKLVDAGAASREDFASTPQGD